jgi:hypothetical protein
MSWSRFLKQGDIEDKPSNKGLQNKQKLDKSIVHNKGKLLVKESTEKKAKGTSQKSNASTMMYSSLGEGLP